MMAWTYKDRRGKRKTKFDAFQTNLEKHEYGKECFSDELKHIFAGKVS